MSTENDLTFETDKVIYKSRSILGQPQSPFMVKKLIDYGVVKNEKQAVVIMWIATFCFFGLSAYIIYSSFFS